MKGRLPSAAAIVFLGVMIALLDSCAYVNVSLPRAEGPLKEKVISGKGKDKILLISLENIISDEKRSRLIGGREESVVGRVKEELDKAAKDGAVKAVVVRINSPGGTATASDIVYQELRSYKEKKGVKAIACMMDLAASGGYMAAVACDKIVAHPTSITGSIGVIALKINAGGLLQKIGVENETMKAGDKKDMVSPLRGLTPEEREILQKVLDELKEQFEDRVATGRKNLTLQQVKALADGRIFTAKQALTAGLIDRIGYLEDAIELAKTEANLTDAKVVAYHQPSGYKSTVYSEVPDANPSTINLLNIDLGALLKGGGVSFMYLWMP